MHFSRFEAIFQKEARSCCAVTKELPSIKKILWFPFLFVGL